MKSVEIQQNIAFDFDRSRIWIGCKTGKYQLGGCLCTRHRQKQRLCFHKACCLSFFAASLISVRWVVLFIDEFQRLGGADRQNVLLMEQIMSKSGFFRALWRIKEEDVKADEKVEEENFQQDTTLPQIYPCVCLHTTAYHKIHAKRPKQCYPQITLTLDRCCEMKWLNILSHCKGQFNDYIYIYTHIYDRARSLWYMETLNLKHLIDYTLWLLREL